MQKQRIPKFKLISHEHQIADTGDYDGGYEISNGKVSIFTNDDDDEALGKIVKALNESKCKFYLDDSDAFEAKIITEENKRLHFMIENGVGFEDMIGWPDKSNNLPYQLDDVYNISNNAQCMHDGQKSKATVSLNGPWLETIKNLCRQTARLMVENRNLKESQTQSQTPSVTENIYEYEIYFDSEPGESIQIQGWYPIETDRIIHKDRIPKYIESGLLRKINNK